MQDELEDCIWEQEQMQEERIATRIEKEKEIEQLKGRVQESSA